MSTSPSWTVCSAGTTSTTAAQPPRQPAPYQRPTTPFLQGTQVQWVEPHSHLPTPHPPPAPRTPHLLPTAAAPPPHTTNHRPRTVGTVLLLVLVAAPHHRRMPLPCRLRPRQRVAGVAQRRPLVDRGRARTARTVYHRIKAPPRAPFVRPRGASSACCQSREQAVCAYVGFVDWWVGAHKNSSQRNMEVLCGRSGVGGGELCFLGSLSFGGWCPHSLNGRGCPRAMIRVVGACVVSIFVQMESRTPDCCTMSTMNNKHVQLVCCPRTRHVFAMLASSTRNNTASSYKNTHTLAKTKWCRGAPTQKRKHT